MKILLGDIDCMMSRDFSFEKSILTDGLKDVCNLEMECYEYENEEKLIEKLKDCDGLVTGFLDLNENVLSKVKNLKMISVQAIGYDNVDVNSASKYGIKVAHIDEYCTSEVSDHAMSLILALSRNLRKYSDVVEKDKKWDFELKNTYALDGQTLGIVGFGRIGKAVAKRAQAFGMNIIVTDPYVTKETEEEYHVTRVSIDTLLEKSDVITNHMNLTKENTGYFNAEKFAKMKKRPIFINVSRGGSVVENDLNMALDKNLIRAAGIDVLTTENPDLDNCPLLNRENVIVTPHSAFYSDAAMKRLQKISCENLIYYFKNEFEKVKGFVN